MTYLVQQELDDFRDRWNALIRPRTKQNHRDICIAQTKLLEWMVDRPSAIDDLIKAAQVGINHG